MPFSLTTRRVRLQSDYSVDGAVIDRLTGKEISIPLASDVRIEIGIFAGLNGNAPGSAAQVASETGWESLTLTLQKQRGSNVVSKTVSTFTSLTAGTWNDDTAQHCVVDLTDAETNIAPGKYRLALTVQSSTFGPYPVGTADIQVFDPHNLNSSDPADENPGAPISRDAADARYAPIGGGSSALSAGKTLFVDAIYGDDNTGTRQRMDKAFLTLAAAIDAMQPGDLVHVRPGTYAESLPCKEMFATIDTIERASNVVTVTTIEEHGLSVGCPIVHAYVDAAIGSPATTFDGQFIVRSVPTTTSYTVAQLGANESASIGGAGLVLAIGFYHFENGAVVAPPASTVTVDLLGPNFSGLAAALITGEGTFLSSGGAPTAQGGIWLEWNGRLARAMTTSGGVPGAAACLSVGGYEHLRMRFIDGIISDGYDALLGICGPDTYIYAPVIIGGNNAPAETGISPNAMEINAPIVGVAVIECGRAISRAGHAINIATDIAYAGRLTIRVGSVEGISSGIALTGNGGAQTVDIMAQVVSASAGPAVLDSTTASADVVRIHGARLESTYNNAAGYAVKKTGSTATLVLDNCTLVPHATANESINSGGASRTVTCFGSKTAYALGTGVSAPGLLIDSDVK